MKTDRCFERTGAHAEGCPCRRRSLRTWLPHRSPVAHRSFTAAIAQIVGGRRWSLCLVTRIDDAAPGHDLGVLRPVVAPGDDPLPRASSRGRR